ncbi:hypothetical protein CRG98_045720 [Punica granatum]|uniref:non-specific serine/threonine protein kinase n=1 Tax=Punica granatum TaxID=22663 RepID=A0A2I0HR03_PUNGR|nr:hypothetical protein CRG98_045720 [Punica granatum]
MLLKQPGEVLSKHFCGVVRFNPEISLCSSESSAKSITEIEFHIEVQQAGDSPREVAVRAARDFGATWVILDKHMKKDKAYLMEQLPCRISVVKHNNAIKDLQQMRVTVDPDVKRISRDAACGSHGNEEFQNPVCSVCRNRRPKIGWKRNFTFEELQAATEGFSAKNFIAQSTFGFLYRGELNGLKIVVKQMKSTSFQQEEFTSSFSALSGARHENLAVLLGICSEGNHRILVYEYICNRSLEFHLSEYLLGRSLIRPLNWDQRMKIAFGAAKGLKYLHENDIVHGKFRPSNILLTHDHEARVGNFGLSTVEHGASFFSSGATFGKLVYYAPEYAELGKASTKTDCFAFGVMLLQLITGLGTADPILRGKNLVRWARPLLKDRNYPGLLDQRIGDSYDIHQLFWIIRVAEKCLKKNPHSRISMEKVVSTLGYLMEGNTVPVLRNFSPSESESKSSPIDSSRSTCDDDKSSSGQGVETSNL